MLLQVAGSSYDGPRHQSASSSKGLWAVIKVDSLAAKLVP
jgi:hypothetical protein